MYTHTRTQVISAHCEENKPKNKTNETHQNQSESFTLRFLNGGNEAKKKKKSKIQ